MNTEGTKAYWSITPEQATMQQFLTQQVASDDHLSVFTCWVLLMEISCVVYGAANLSLAWISVSVFQICAGFTDRTSSSDSSHSHSGNTLTAQTSHQCSYSQWIRRAMITNRIPQQTATVTGGEDQVMEGVCISSISGIKWAAHHFSHMTDLQIYTPHTVYA